MANRTMKKTNIETVIADEVIIDDIEIVEDIKPVKTSQVKSKKFTDTDLIPCLSITPGELFMVGEKSKNLYSWADADDCVEVEYRDLLYAVRTNSKLVFKPRFIIQDDDFLAAHKNIEEVYGSLYSVQDLKDILQMSPKQMEKEILALPGGAKDALKSIAVTMIDRGQLDSVQRIKVLDQIFETELLMKLTNG